MNQQHELRGAYGLLFAPGTDTKDVVRVLMPDRAGSVSALRFQAVNVGQGDASEPVESVKEDPAAALRVMIDAAREEAVSTALRELEAETEQRVRAERQRMIEVCERFVRDRQRYFAAAEEQVVKLALAVAARVLHREAQADPLLLTSAVRAALARVQDGSAATLRVPTDEFETWVAVFPAGSEPMVQVCADERMTKGQCVLETIVGRVDLSVTVQLEEVARGFAELVQGHTGQGSRTKGWELK